MEQVIEQIIAFLLQLAEKYTAVSTILFIIGGLYVLLTAIRGLLTLIVKATKTQTDDKIIATIFAFLDKYAFGFGKLAEYYETHSKKEAKK